MKTALIVILFASLVGNAYQYQHARTVGSQAILQVTAANEPVVMRTKGGLLEVSSIKVQERFDASEIHSFFGANLGKTATRIRVPVVYRYHIELAPEWTIHLADKKFVVIAPAVKPSLPVAVDTTGIEKESFGVWSVLTGTTLLDKLERSISPALASRAVSINYVQLQRAASRQTVKEFVAKWLVTQDRWKTASEYPIQVYFSDEPIQVLGNAAPDAAASPRNRRL
ncbi:hypothetical protein Q4S45_13935 [Massilia sp. R2A-15]|uniref:hypothetical protein n=1 Tax=Massilia sp. R2A-15 TaxID=3064278 RepID=UPI0027324130|nr:hypothetical protein [Massilia sp. R2A-15]WLI87837.1 hypothetical protein Q4S45_13935 [Massilia sp. R2A-15]